MVEKPTYEALEKKIQDLEELCFERKLAEAVLQEANDQLEIRVGERAMELAKANEELHAEIVEHKQAKKNIKRKYKIE